MLRAVNGAAYAPVTPADGIASPRHVSNVVFARRNVQEPQPLSLLHAYWSQFVANDMLMFDATGVSQPISVPADDAHFEANSEIPFNRAALTASAPTNKVSSYVDASTVYSSDIVAPPLQRTGDVCKLNMQQTDNGAVLPRQTTTRMTNGGHSAMSALRHDRVYLTALDVNANELRGQLRYPHGTSMFAELTRVANTTTNIVTTDVDDRATVQLWYDSSLLRIVLGMQHNVVNATSVAVLNANGDVLEMLQIDAMQAHAFELSTGDDVALLAGDIRIAVYKNGDTSGDEHIVGHVFTPPVGGASALVVTFPFAFLFVLLFRFVRLLL
jgi:hypothetical protein